MQTESAKGSPASFSIGRRRSLIVIGTDVTLRETIRKKAEADLGFDIVFRVLPEREAEKLAFTAPASFDLYDHFFHSLDLVWSAGVIQPIDVARLAHWNKVTALTKAGSLSNSGQIGNGEAPVKRLFVQSDGSLHRRPSGAISMVPLVHNFDSFGYVPKGEQSGESWSWLLDPKWHGRVALVGNPAIGMLEAALAAEAAGLLSFGDIGQLKLKEVDQLMALLAAYVRKGHFQSFWSTPPEAEDVLLSGQASLSSLWSPSLLQLRRRGLKLRSAEPAEGYRAWHGGLSLAARIEKSKLDLAYEYMNWWLAGVPGALLARDGHYISAPETARNHMTEAEWQYWYMGEAATSDLPGVDGEVVVHRGDVRDGGSYANRVSKIAVWNSTMPEHNYVVRHWRELVAALPQAPVQQTSAG